MLLGCVWQVDEYMGDTENAAVYYSKAVHLLVFLLVEAAHHLLSILPSLSQIQTGIDCEITLMS